MPPMKGDIMILSSSLNAVSSHEKENLRYAACADVSAFNQPSPSDDMYSPESMMLSEQGRGIDNS